MSGHPQQRDYFDTNTTKIYNANLSGYVTTTYLRDFELASYNKLLFDLIAKDFSNGPLRRPPPRQITTPFEASARSRADPRPALTATRSAEAVLIPSKPKHQQVCGHTKPGSNQSGSAISTPPSEESSHDTTHREHRIRPFSTSSAGTSFRSCGRLQPRSNPYGSSARIAAKSVGALLPLPEHPTNNHHTELSHQPSTIDTGSADLVLPKHDRAASRTPRSHSNAAKSGDLILPPRTSTQVQEVPSRPGAPQQSANVTLSSTTSLPDPAMAPEHPHHVEPDPPDLFTAMENPHQNPALSPQRQRIFAIRSAKKAARVGAAQKMAEERKRERFEKAAKKIRKENAGAARRAEREIREAGEKMKKFEMEAEKQRLRREQQVASMEKRRRMEEAKEKAMEARRHKKALEGMCWGFDPRAGTRVSRESGSASGEANAGDEESNSEELEGSGLLRVRSGTTWGVSGGSPGKTAGYHRSGVS